MEFMEGMGDYWFNFSSGENISSVDFNDFFPVDFTPEIKPIQITALVLYGLVVLLGVPGNLVVIWVTGFCMTRSVTSLWFLNLALADLLCCLSLPLLMVPLAHDDHWHFGPLACTLVKGVFFLVMYCSVLQLVLISLDRLVLVTMPVWCQNHRRTRKAAFGCAAVWLLALLVSVPQFIYAREIEAGVDKRECLMAYPRGSVWLVFSARLLLSFILPFLIIVGCHVVVYKRTERTITRSRNRSKRTIRIILAVVLSFFLCWLPLHIVDFLILRTRPNSPHRPSLYLAHTLCLCLAYFNSCLNPLLYVCIGRSFKESMNRSLCGILHFLSDEPSRNHGTTTMNTRNTNTDSSTKSSSLTKGMTKV